MKETRTAENTDAERVETARNYVRQFPELHIPDDFTLADVTVTERVTFVSQTALTLITEPPLDPTTWEEHGWRVELPGGWLVNLDATGVPTGVPRQRKS
jgi:hypothetical protein